MYLKGAGPGRREVSVNKKKTTDTGCGVGGVGHAQIPGIKVKPAGRTTPADVFSTVPLVEDEDCCHVGLLV